MNNPDHISGMEKTRIRDKHPGSATLGKTFGNSSARDPSSWHRKKYTRCGSYTVHVAGCILWTDECSSSTAHRPIPPTPRPLTLHYICMAKTPDIVSGGRIKDLTFRRTEKKIKGTRAHAPLIRTFSSSKRIEDKSILGCSCHFRGGGLSETLVDNGTSMHRVPLYPHCHIRTPTPPPPSNKISR